MARSLRRYLASLVTAIVMMSAAGSGVAAAPPDMSMVPLRAVAEATGAQVAWDAATATVTVTRGDVTLVLRIGEATATLNGTNVPLPAPITVVNGRTMIPLAVLNAALGIEATIAPGTGKPVVDLVATRALDFMKALAKGTVDTAGLSPALKAAMPAPRLAAIAAQLQQMGPIVQMSVVGHTQNAVHENVQFVALIGQIPMDVTIRFDATGLVDDYYMNVYAGPPAAAGSPTYAYEGAFTEKEVVVGAGTAFPLPGTLTLPAAGQGPFPAIVLVHGSGPNDRDETVGGVKPFRDLAQGLASRGIAVLRYEKRTREHSQKVVMLPGFGLQAETTADALLAARFLSEQKSIDPRRIFVLGHSQGGFALPLMLEQDKEKIIAGGIIVAGPNSFLDTLLEQNRLMIEAKLLPEAQMAFIQQQVAMVRDPAFNPARPPQGFMLGFPQYFLDLRDPVAPLVAKQGIPMLIFQGARDFQVPVSQFESWQKELADREAVTFKLYPKLNHVLTEGEGPLGFLDEYQKQANVPVYVIEDITKWIRDH